MKMQNSLHAGLSGTVSLHFLSSRKLLVLLSSHILYIILSLRTFATFLLESPILNVGHTVLT